MTHTPFAGGTRFIGVYLARQLIEQGHSVTLLTRGKKDVTFQIPDDTDESYANYKSAVKHIASDRKDKEGLKEKLSGKTFDGEGQSLEMLKDSGLLTLLFHTFRELQDSCCTASCW